jgi:sortase A
VLGACGGTGSSRGRSLAAATLPPVTAAARATVPPTTPAPVTPAVPAPVTAPTLSLLSPYVAVPLRLELPSIRTSGPVLAVGITAAKAMDAPEGPANDPVWQDAFWYRGGAIPGAVGTATIAGHVDDSLGRPAMFGRLDELRPGDPIVVQDLRTGLEVHFVVDATASYTLAQAATTPVLEQIYGTGPVHGLDNQPTADGLAHLTLITCAGKFDYSKGTHDHRLVVYATRVA